MSATGPAVSANQFRRVNRRCLVALPFALALTVWLAAAESWQDYRAIDAPAVIDVGADASGRYAGSAWQLIAFDRVAAAPGRSVPAGVAHVRVEIAVTPGDATAIRALGTCAVELAVADGRRWSAVGGDLFAPGALPERCDGDYQRKPEPGKALHFEQFFSVPDGDAAAVVPIVSIGRRATSLLRLRRN